MKRLLALVVKEFLQLKRDRTTLGLIVMIPIIQTLLFGYAINYDVKHLKMTVLDESRSWDSRELVSKLTASEYFDVVSYVDSLEALRREIDAGHVSVGLVIDRAYGKARHQGAPAHALLIVNASDTVISRLGRWVANGAAGDGPKKIYR